MEWYRLDNAAKLFPSVTNVKNSSVFRISAVLKEEIDQALLQKAVDVVLPRFPMLSVRLRRGVFWNYLDASEQRLMVEKEEFYPCRYINPRGNRNYLVRVLYGKNRMSVETFHSLTDGTGATEFLKSVLYYYLIFQGNEIDHENKILLAEDSALASDMEDSAQKYYNPDVGKNEESKKRAFRMKGHYFEHYGSNVISGIISAAQLNQLAKQKGATITAYLTALLIYAIYHTQAGAYRSRRKIVIAIPVNLRKPFSSKTLRNFFGVVNISVPITRDTSFDQLLEQVSVTLKEKTQKENLEKILSANLKFEVNKAAKLTPLVLKNLFVNLGFQIMGESRKSMTLSNTGNVILPKEMYAFMHHMELNIYSSKKSPINCSVCSCNDKLVCSFTRAIEESEMIQRFFSYLAKEAGLDVEIYSNDWGILHEKM